MSIQDDETLQMYVEESREHLDSIEEDLLVLEKEGAGADEELVNKVFRAAHSIKGGASFLGLENVKDLAHKIENVLGMIRGGEMLPSSDVVNVLLSSFDRLRELIDRVDASDSMDISEHVAALVNLASSCLSSEERSTLLEMVDICLPDGRSVFPVSRFDLDQADKAGKFIYLIEYDLIHDVHRKGKTPLDIANLLQDCGAIMESKVDIGAVGLLEDDSISNSLPLFVLFATIIDPDIIHSVFELGSKKVHPITAREIAKFPVQTAAAPGAVVDASPSSAVSASHGANAPASESSSGFGAASNGTGGEVHAYRISFRPHSDILRKGSDPIYVLNDLQSLGDADITAKRDAIPGLEEIDPEQCYTSWDITLTTVRDMNDIRDAFILIEDDVDLRIEVVGDPDIGEDPPGVADTAVEMDDDTGEAAHADSGDAAGKKLGEILVERGHATPEQIESALGGRKRIGEILVESGVVEPAHVKSALAVQQSSRQTAEKRQNEEALSSIRVPAEKLDHLVNLVGELVTVQARLSQMVASTENSALLTIAEEVEMLTAELRDSAMSIRMLPIGTTFNKFKRLVRDLSRELAKDVVIITEGEDTELDKTVIERLNDPLVHLVRNSVDHGIEPPDVREASGKPRQGTVCLSAMHSGANVLIRIEDDGAGLDGEAILNRALERGLVTPDAELSESDIFGLIFAPGFSTARKVTNVSGRGVGMDVVKRSIEALRGIVDVDSRKGAGTTITLKLPLTLAIIDGLLVGVEDGIFVLPLSAVQECVELTREDVERAHGRHLAYVRGEIIPYVRLREQFGIEGEPPDIEQVVVIETAGMRIGFVVDRVIGEHQTVIKNLGRMYRDVKGFSGATILGDGTVALIMDAAQIVHHAEIEELPAGMAMTNPIM